MKDAQTAGRFAPVPKRLWLIGGALLVAAVAATVLILASRGGSGPAEQPASIVGAVQTAALLQGIPQHGTALGSPQAPVTLVEYGDLQCPICASWATQALPTIVGRYVRTGKVRLEFRGLAFLGPDSLTALRTALAAAPAGKLWNVVDLLYRNQGGDNSGWVTASLLQAVVGAVGLEAKAVLAARSSTAVTDALTSAAQQASLDGVPGTPTFELGRTGGNLEPVHLTTFDPSQLSAAIDAALAK